MSSYQCLYSTQEYSIEDYKIVPLRYEDIFHIKQWRNEQIDILRQKKQLSDADQEQYYRKVIEPLFQQENPSQIIFSYLHKNELIGYGGLVYVNWMDKRAEVSFLINTERAQEESIYREDFLAYLELVKQVAFQTLKFNRLFTETFDIRDKHIGILEEAGFVREGTMKEHVLIKGTFIDSILHGYLRKYYHAER